MSRYQRMLLLTAISLAVVVEASSALGWWRWSTLRRDMAQSPAVAAARLIDDPLLALPPTLALMPGLSGRALAEAPIDQVVLGLQRIGKLQERWLPADPRGALNQARAQLLLGNLAGGKQDLERALRRDPTSAELHRLLARVLRLAGYPQEALEQVADALAINPNRRELPIDLTPEDEESVRLAALQRRVDLYPRKRVQVLLELAWAYRQRGQGEQMSEVLAPVTGEPDVQLQLAEWSIETGQIGPELLAGIEELARRRRYPVRIRVKAWSLLARARDLAGDQEGALAAADEAVRLGPGSPVPYLVLADMAERRGDDETALTHLRRAWGVAPTNVKLLLSFATVAERCGELTDARVALQRAAEIDASSPDIAARLVAFQLRRGDYLNAALLLSRLLERFPTDPQLLALAQRLRHEVSPRADEHASPKTSASGG